MDQTRPLQNADKRREHLACRTIDLGLDGFGECSHVGPNTCKYAVPFGYAFLCCHPELQERQRAIATGAVSG